MASCYYVYNKNSEVEGLESESDAMDFVINHCKTRVIQYMNSKQYNAPYQYLYICLFKGVIGRNIIRWALTSSLTEMNDFIWGSSDNRKPDKIYRFLIFSTDDSYNIMELSEEAEDYIIVSEKKCYALYNMYVLEAMKKFGKKKGESDETI